MMERKAKNSTGYTLVEFMVSMALLTIIMLGAYGVLVTGDTIYVKDNNLMNMQGQTRNAVDRMVRESRPATSQTIVTNFNSTTNDKITIFSPTTPTGVQYYLSGTNLVRAYGGKTQNVASNVSLLKFTQSASLLQIQVTTSRSVYGVATTFPLIEKVRFRNE
jgi:prepilin-type N-terminal cleavage/methylation domain-containing protein